MNLFYEHRPTSSYIILRHHVNNVNRGGAFMRVAAHQSSKSIASSVRCRIYKRVKREPLQ